MGILANVIGTPITTMAGSAGGASFGAAILAGVGAEEYSSLEQACGSEDAHGHQQSRRPDSVVEPIEGEVGVKCNE